MFTCHFFSCWSSLSRLRQLAFSLCRRHHFSHLFCASRLARHVYWQLTAHDGVFECVSQACILRSRGRWPRRTCGGDWAISATRLWRTRRPTRAASRLADFAVDAEPTRTAVSARAALSHADARRSRPCVSTAAPLRPLHGQLTVRRSRLPRLGLRIPRLPLELLLAQHARPRWRRQHACSPRQRASAPCQPQT